MLDNFQFDNIKEAIAGLSKLIAAFTQMLKNFVASWKKTITAATSEQQPDIPAYEPDPAYPVPEN